MTGARVDSSTDGRCAVTLGESLDLELNAEGELQPIATALASRLKQSAAFRVVHHSSASYQPSTTAGCSDSAKANTRIARDALARQAIAGKGVVRLLALEYRDPSGCQMSTGFSSPNLQTAA